VISAQHDFQYAQEAIRLGASDYIPKPYNAEDVIAALEKVITKRTKAAQAAAELSLLKQQLQDKADNSVPTPNTAEVLYLRDGQEKLAVPIANVCCVEADNHHVVIHTIDGKCFRQYVSFKEYIKRLEGHDFVTPHRSYLVALKHIIKLVPEFVVLRAEGKYEKKVPLSKGNISRIKKAWQAIHEA
jgi:DNA-binding LytR/AlgR family response regulator